MFDNRTHRDVRVDEEGRIVPSPSVVGNWETAQISKAGTTTQITDLGGHFMYLQAIIPTIDTGTVKVQVGESAGSTFYNLGDTQTTTSGTHNYATIFKLGGFRFVRLVASASQDTAAVDCRLRGVTF